MKKIGLIFTLLFAVATFFMTSCDELDDFLTQDETAAGLKEALRISTDTTVMQAGVVDGYFGNAAIKILFPPEAQQILNTIDNNPLLAGLIGGFVDDFVQKMNRAAEQAAPLAKDIFVETITNITISDALGILNGDDNAATNFLENNARQPLYNSFRPIIENKVSDTGADQVWGQITDGYNTFTGNAVNTDLNDYVTNKALDGLFVLIAKEEEKIRNDPFHRVTDLLQRVFGN